MNEKALFPENEEESSLYNIVTNVVLPEVYHERLLKCEAIGEDLNKAFLEQRLSPNPKKSIWAPLKRASIKTFTAANKVIKTAKEQKNQVVTEHRGLFSRMAIIARSQRLIDMKDVISNFELSVTVRSLMNNDGSLILGDLGKSKLMHCLSDEVVTESINDHNGPSCAIIGAMVILQTIDTSSSEMNNCEDAADAFTRKDIQKRGNNMEDQLVFDTYKDNSLKEMTRSHR